MEKEKERKGVTLSNLAVKHLVAELAFLENGFVNNVQSLENNWTKMKIHTKKGDKTIAFTDNSVFVLNKSIPAKQNPGGFSALLKKYLYNQRIVSLKQHRADRIIVFEFPNSILIAELFAKGNLVLCEKDYKIIKALKKEEWKDRKLEKDQQYKYPSSKGTDPVEESEEEFISKLKESKKSFFGACVDILNSAPAVLEKAFSDTGAEKEVDSSKISNAVSKKVLQKVKQIYESEPKTAYLNKGIIYTVDLNLEKEKEFASVSEALNSILLSEEKVTNPKEKKKVKFDESGKINQINKEIEKLENEEKKFKENGDMLYLKYSEIKTIVETIKKGKNKGLSSKEIMEKINSIKPFITELDLERNKLKLRL